jgi:hypothetical protein
MVSILLRHGPDGAGNPAIAKMFEVEMRDFTEGKGKMKPVASVSGPAADNVVAYLRSLKKWLHAST